MLFLLLIVSHFLQSDVLILIVVVVGSVELLAASLTMIFFLAIFSG